MNQKGSVAVLAVIVVIIILVVGGLWYYATRTNTSPSPQATSTATFSPEANPTTLPTAQAEHNTIVETPIIPGSLSKNIFSIPPLYNGYVWETSSSSYPHALDLSGNSNFNGTLSGTLYEATNTDPAAAAWKQSSKNCTSDCGFYAGDQAVLNYYDRALQADGYLSQELDFDQNLNVTTWDNAVYSFSPIEADGPEGTVRGYIKYYNGFIKVIVIDSSAISDKIFVSAIVGLDSLIK